MFIKRTKIFPKYFLKMIGGATFVFGGSTQNLLEVPLGEPIGGASGSPNDSPGRGALYKRFHAARRGGA